MVFQHVRLSIQEAAWSSGLGRWERSWAQALDKHCRLPAWSSGLGRWIWNLEVPGWNNPPYRYLDLFTVVPSSTPRSRCVNSQLVSLPPVGILNSLCYIYNIWLLIYSVPNLHTSAKYIRHLIKLLLLDCRRSSSTWTRSPRGKRLSFMLKITDKLANRGTVESLFTSFEILF